MSRARRNKKDGVWDGYYAPHLQMANNPIQNQQQRIYRMYVRILSELAMNRFKWTGLPETIDPRFLELTLLQSALAVFYFDEEYQKYFALQGTPAGELNMYQNPTSFQVLGNRFISKRLSAMPRAIKGSDLSKPEECIPIWANYLRMPDTDIIMTYAQKLATIDRTIEINAANARRPKILAVNPNMRLSIENINRQIDEGQAAIEINLDTFDQTVGGLSALDLGVNPDTIEKIQISRTRMWNECMGLLGINNANQDKKERLVSDEVAANDDQVDSMRWVSLNARRIAAHQINVRYPELKVGVTYHVQDAPEPAPLSSSDFADNGDDEAEEEIA